MDRERRDRGGSDHQDGGTLIESGGDPGKVDRTDREVAGAQRKGDGLARQRGGHAGKGNSASKIYAAVQRKPDPATHGVPAATGPAPAVQSKGNATGVAVARSRGREIDR
jgi:hypothetical protein